MSTTRRGDKKRLTIRKTPIGTEETKDFKKKWRSHIVAEQHKKDNNAEMKGDKDASEEQRQN
eukprot:5319125-Amphidinium_carterae.1